MNSADITTFRPTPSRQQPALDDGPRELDFPRRLALFVCAMHRERTLELLEGLADAPRTDARHFARYVATLDSASRQARLTVEFGLRPNPAVRVQTLLDESPPLLRAALWTVMPTTSRERLRPPANAPATAAISPALRALAVRLIREVSRQSPAGDGDRHNPQ